MNELFTQMMKGNGLQAATTIIASLRNELTDHLKSEEAVMARMGYPSLAQHRQDHEAFGNRFHQLEQTMRPGDVTSTTAILEFVADWVSKHIMQHDRLMADFMKKHNAA